MANRPGWRLGRFYVARGTDLGAANALYEERWNEGPLRFIGILGRKWGIGFVKGAS